MRLGWQFFQGTPVFRFCTKTTCYQLRDHGGKADFAGSEPPDASEQFHLDDQNVCFSVDDKKVVKNSRRCAKNLDSQETSIRQMLARHPRDHAHFTLIRPSGIKLVKRFFATLTNKRNHVRQDHVLDEMAAPFW
jgi:hypothetical protein